MRPVLLRPAVLLAVAALATPPAPALAATGVFEYCSGPDCRMLTDPWPGACFTLEITATHVKNGTDTLATLYAGRHCSEEGETVEPGEERAVSPSNSVIFYS
jgi:hypothetical protein